MSDEQIRFQPYQEDDFVKKNDRIVAYRGPIFTVLYPLHCKMPEVITAWAELGFTVDNAGMQEYCDNSRREIMILGDIPLRFQEDLVQAGCEVQQTKPRGEAVPYTR